jgi:hypothetical protein
MVMDRNPSFARDENFEISARKVADMLWEASKGDLASIPNSYVEGLSHDYSDGSVSLLNLLNRVTLTEKTYEEFSEVVERLIYTQDSDWPAKDSILEVQAEKLLHDSCGEGLSLSELDFDLSFAETGNMSDKIELFLKKVISSVYLDGVSAVTDKDGNPPNASNSYLQSPDGKSFSGTFFDNSESEKPKKFDFEIMKGSKGDWTIKY